MSDEPEPSAQWCPMSGPEKNRDEPEEYRKCCITGQCRWWVDDAKKPDCAIAVIARAMDATA